jgi:uncharacterized membrane protein HdeD (DUF308 family)
MSTEAVVHEHHELHKMWGWLAASGIALVLLGGFALIDSITVSILSMLVFAWVLILAGIIQAVQAVRHRHAHHFLLHVLNAVFALVLGVILLRNSLAGLLVMTLLLAAYFVVVGIFRIIAGATMKTPGAGWTLFDGIISLLLGLMVWAHWPMAALWIIGLFIGINLIITGCSQVMLAMALKKFTPKTA